MSFNKVSEGDGYKCCLGIEGVFNNNVMYSCDLDGTNSRVDPIEGKVKEDICIDPNKTLSKDSNKCCTIILNTNPDIEYECDTYSRINNNDCLNGYVYVSNDTEDDKCCRVVENASENAVYECNIDGSNTTITECNDGYTLTMEGGNSVCKENCNNIENPDTTLSTVCNDNDYTFSVDHMNNNYCANNNCDISNGSRDLDKCCTNVNNCNEVFQCNEESEVLNNLSFCNNNGQMVNCDTGNNTHKQQCCSCKPGYFRDGGNCV